MQGDGARREADLWGSRSMWQSLSVEPDVRPVDWMRSSTRRHHLIALGVPINLDEVRVADGAGAKTLPPLALKLDQKPGQETNGKPSRQRNGTPDGRESKVPELDMVRAKELVSLSEGECECGGRASESTLTPVDSPHRQINSPYSPYRHFEICHGRWTC